MLTKIYNGKEVENRFFILMEKIDDNERMTIINSIFHIRDNYNWKPVPPIAKPLYETWDEELFEFRISLSKILIRINYFIDYEINCIVLLNWYEKPNWSKDKNSYNKAKKKQLDKLIKQSIEIALVLKKEYNINNNDYELLN
jgi:hypothetical protein